MALAVTALASPGSASGAATLAVNVSSLSFAIGDLCHVETTVFDSVTFSVGAPTATSETFTKVGQSTWAAGNRSVTSAAWVVCATALASLTVNLASGGTSGPAYGVEVYKVTGHDGTGAETSAFVVRNSTQNEATAAITTAQANEVVFVCETHDGATMALTCAAGWTTGGEVESNTNNPFNSSYQIFSSIQTSLTHTWTNGASSNWGTSAVAYKASTAGAASSIAASPNAQFIYMRGNT